MKINLNKKWHYVAFRITRQRYAKDENDITFVKNGWFLWGQIDDEPTTPDKYALNWELISDYENEEEAKKDAFDLRALEMEFNGVKYCPIYNNGGYAYEGSY